MLSLFSVVGCGRIWEGGGEGGLQRDGDTARTQEVKQIHTSGPSRAVQRSVSVLGETGFVHRHSAI